MTINKEAVKADIENLKAQVTATQGALQYATQLLAAIEKQEAEPAPEPTDAPTGE